MKSFLMGVASFLFAMYFFLFLHDYNLNKYYLDELKFTCEEASAAGSLFISWEDYGDGIIVFNYEESEKAIYSVIAEMLKLDLDINNFNMKRKNNSYWKDDNIEVNIVFYDEHEFSNSGVNPPKIGKRFSIPDERTGITEPSIIVEINAGKANYRLKYLNTNDNIRSSIHTWRPWGEDGI